MKRRPFSHAVLPAAMLSLVFFWGSNAFAQDGEGGGGGGANAARDKALLAKPTPRQLDEHPDLSGVWGAPGGGDRDTLKPDGSITLSGGGTGGKPASEDPDNLHAFLDYHGINHERRVNGPNVPPYKPELQAKVKDLDYNANFKDPAFFCKPPGVPRMGPPAQIFQRPGAVVFLYVPLSGNRYREIPTDGRAHDPLDLDTYDGDSVGHWEGDTLVVDSINFNDDTWFSADGYFHSDKMHVVEKFRRQGDIVYYDVTVTDPEVFTKPWVMPTRIMRPFSHKQVSATDVLEENPPCIEREEVHIKAVDGHEH